MPKSYAVPTLCECGCGGTFPVGPGAIGRNRCFLAGHNPREKNDKVDRSPRLCECGCGRSFIDTSRGRTRKFFDIHQCALWNSQKKYRRKRRGDIAEKYREIVCCGQGLDGLAAFQGPCGNILHCMDRETAGRRWLFEENGGMDCYRC